jgi:signal transduction histidine kinase
MFYNSITDHIRQIEMDNVGSNTEIESDMISKIFAKSVESVADNLRLISSTPSIQNKDRSGIELLSLAEHNTDNLTDFYVWLDSKGKVIGTSSAIDGTDKKLANDLSNTTFFSIPEKTYGHYVSDINFFEGIPRMFISVPILDGNTISQTNAIAETTGKGNISTNISTSAVGRFEGIIAAAIRVDELGRYLQSQIPPEYNGIVGVVDSKGMMLSSSNLSHIGKNVFETNMSPFIPSKAKDSFDHYLHQSLFEKRTKVQNITYGNRHIAIGYQPLVLGQPIGNQFATLFVISSHLSTDEIGSLIQQQATFSISVYAIILLLATGLAFVVLSWNKKLKELVNKKTKELQKSNQNLKMAYERLKVNDKTQKDFVNIAAHELRTPIQAIMGNAEMAISKPQYRAFDNKNGRILNAISRNALRLHRLTELILDVAKIESNLLKINKEMFNINEKVKQVVDDFRNKHIEALESSDVYSHKKTKEAELIFAEPKVNSITAEADPVRFEQILSNLIENAIKFIDKEDGKVTISVDVDAEETSNHNGICDIKKKLMVSVKDNGRGIHPDILHNLFDKFTSKAEFGTGLGLFISKSIVEAHGGKIWAKNNNDGKGATFSFSLPLND